jgi:hypothetical protein
MFLLKVVLALIICAIIGLVVLHFAFPVIVEPAAK